jgi:hypothetical protein
MDRRAFLRKLGTAALYVPPTVIALKAGLGGFSQTATAQSEEPPTPTPTASPTPRPDLPGPGGLISLVRRLLRKLFG